MNTPVALLICWALQATAPDEATAVLSGRVLARGSADRLAGATILVDGAPAGEADAEGRFVVSVRPGRRMVQVQHPGFEPLMQAVDAAAGTPPLILRLEPATGGERYETVVRAAPAEAPRVHLEREEITKTPGSLGDPFRVIESLPGVAPLLWPLPVYAVRGANPGNTGFFIDGLRVPALFHFALGPAVIHPHFLEGLEFYAGGYPARYGRYVAGVVAASTTAPPGDRVRGSVDVRAFDGGGLISVPVNGGRGTVTAAGRYAYPAALLTALQSEVNFQYWDYQARIDHRLGPGRLSLFAFGSYDVLEPKGDDDADRIDGPRDGSERLALVFHRAHLRWRGAVGRGRLVAAVGVGIDETASPFDDNALVARGRSLVPRLTYDRALGDAVDLEIGAEGEISDYDTRVRFANTELAGFVKPRQPIAGALHSSLVLRLGSRVVLSPAVRLDGYAESGTRALDLAPRLGVRVRAADGLWVKASGGRFSQMPSMPLQLPGFEGFGLGDYGLQTSWQAAVGLEAALPGRLALDSSTFVQRYVLTDIRDPDLGDPLLADFLTRRHALSYGFELMLRRPPGERWNGWLSYTLSRSLRAFEGGVIGPADWDQRHILNVVAAWRWHRWTFGGRFHLHTGRPVWVDGTRPSELARLPAFHQFDVRVDRRFLFDRFVLDAYVELVNATLADQVVALERTRAGLERRSFEIVLPSVGVRAEY